MSKEIQKDENDSKLLFTPNAYDELQAIIDDEGWIVARQWASENFMPWLASRSMFGVLIFVAP